MRTKSMADNANNVVLSFLISTLIWGFIVYTGIVFYNIYVNPTPVDESGYYSQDYSFIKEK